MIPKRGLGWPWDNTANEFHMYEDALARHKIGWLYNWEMWMPSGFPNGLDYVAQVRLGSKATEIESSLDNLPGHHVSHVIGFNEPEIAEQSNMSVDAAVELWHSDVLPAKAKFHFRLGSPAVSSDPKGREWLESFHKLGGVGVAGVDFIAIHWYGADVRDLEHFVTAMHEAFDRKPVWLTEFAYSHLRTAPPPAPTEQEVLDFMRQALQFLNGCAFVERYAYFGAATDVGDWVGRANNFSHDGSLTAVGRLYAN